MSGTKHELRETVKDWQRTGDAWGHAVALWQVLTGRVKPSDRYELARRDGDGQERKTERG
jgi:hypothetical protein